MFDFRRNEVYKWIAISFGIGLPGLFMAVCMGVTGVSYRLYNVCIPNGKEAFQTWFVWLLIFSGGTAFVLFVTVGYCIWAFALSAIAANRGAGQPSAHGQDASVLERGVERGNPTQRTTRRKKRVEWDRVKRVLYLQWRTSLLGFLVLNITIFYGLTFVSQTEAIENSSHGITEADEAWGICLITTRGNKKACLGLSSGLGLSEARVVATLVLTSVRSRIGVLTIRLADISMTDHWTPRLRPHGPQEHDCRLVGIPPEAEHPVSATQNKRRQSGLHHASQSEAYLAEQAAGFRGTGWAEQS